MVWRSQVQSLLSYYNIGIYIYIYNTKFLGNLNSKVSYMWDVGHKL